MCSEVQSVSNVKKYIRPGEIIVKIHFKHRFKLTEVPKKTKKLFELGENYVRILVMHFF